MCPRALVPDAIHTAHLKLFSATSFVSFLASVTTRSSFSFGFASLPSLLCTKSQRSPTTLNETECKYSKNGGRKKERTRARTRKMGFFRGSWSLLTSCCMEEASWSQYRVFQNCCQWRTMKNSLRPFPVKINLGRNLARYYCFNANKNWPISWVLPN